LSPAESRHPRDLGDLLITNIGQLLTLAGPEGPRTGGGLRNLGIVRDAAVLMKEGRIAAAGPREEVEGEAGDAEVLDAEGRLVMPGFVDPHTHAAFAGSREAELAQKLAGKTYAEIAREGGGIRSTVRVTRQASKDQLLEEVETRVRRMVASGTTTLEVKSGYGLTLEDEVKLLEVISTLPERLPVNVVPTFLGAHAVPEEYEGDPQGYVDHLVEDVIPVVAGRGLARCCDVFVEEGFFSASQGREVLLEGQKHGMASKVHADELTACGGAELAAEVRSVSADHLLFSTERGLRAMAQAGVVAVLLPGTSFSSFELPYAAARRFIELGLPVALGTDLSPNSWIESMQFVINLACYQLRMLPEEAICAATVNAAWAIGLGHEVGSLEEGKRGDLIVLEVRDYREVPYRIAANMVREVVKDGRVVTDLVRGRGDAGSLQP
jgi:imidazolonepropionase